MLAAAWEMMRGGGGAAGVTLAAVAKRAGVSRQAIYLFFGSRGGLLTAVTRHQDLTSGTARKLLRAARSAAPRQSIGSVIKIWFDYLPQIHPVAMALQAAAASDREAKEAWSDRMSAIRDVFETIAIRLRESGDLAAGWTTTEAADFMWSQAHFMTWHQLVVERGWTSEKASRRVSEAIRKSILRRP